jgi:hypothetical protein
MAQGGALGAVELAQTWVVLPVVAVAGLGWVAAELVGHHKFRRGTPGWMTLRCQ